jgi:dTDP-4-amino-4,6-dideoxygalactose transaminase
MTADPALPAVEGGPPFRADPMPWRRALGPAERAMLDEAVATAVASGQDPGYRGAYQRRYEADFAASLGGGYAEAVSTGTAALFVAIAALELPKGSEVLVSPVTDPGTLSAVILNGLVPRLVDSMPGSWNAGPEQVAAALGPNVRGAVLVHAAGHACPIEAIAALLAAKGVKLCEDCSQSHGAKRAGRPVGTFGDVAAFSTMYRKASMTGGSGGVVFTRSTDIHRRVMLHADRGKPRWKDDFDWRDPRGFEIPALNHNTDELSCAIGIASLGRLGDTIARRLAYVRGVADGLAAAGGACRGHARSDDDSPFVYPVHVDDGALRISKAEFAKALAAEGIGNNPDYRYVVAEWPYIRPYLAGDGGATPNATAMRESCFQLYLNENYGAREIADTLGAIAKLERYYTASR